MNEFFKKDNPIPIELMLISWSEVKKSLQRRITTFASKFELSGINGYNNFILNVDNHTETLFWLETDHASCTMNDANFILRFTKNPLDIPLDITKGEKKYYHYKGYTFHFFVKELQGELMPDKRYGYCFNKSIECLFGLRFQYEPEGLHIVFGKIVENDCEGFYHAWVESKNKKNDKWLAVVIRIIS